MKLAVIVQDGNIVPYKKDDIIQFVKNISLNESICILDQIPDTNKKTQLEKDGFRVVYLSELIYFYLLQNPPSFSDIMNRKENLIHNDELNCFYSNKTVFVTGGEGFIGSEIVANLLQLSVKKVVVFGYGENSASILCNKHGLDKRFEFILGDIRDKNKIVKSMKKISPDIVFHAAAHKHVPILETYPEEAIKTNVLGTMNTIDAAKLACVKNFVFVSTDKAVNPISALGVSKRIAEKICLAMDEVISDMRIITVRFGNVFGSIGSVVPIFLEQIVYNRPLTMTDPSMLRYFMSVNEATRLVLFSTMVEEGNLFAFDMGKPVSIKELAERLYHYVGMPFNKDNIHIIGNRGGEKESEELLYSFEEILSSKDNKLLVLKNTQAVWSQEKVQSLCQTLSHSVEQDSREHILALMHQYIS